MHLCWLTFSELLKEFSLFKYWFNVFISWVHQELKIHFQRVIFLNIRFQCMLSVWKRRLKITCLTYIEKAQGPTH